MRKTKIDSLKTRQDLIQAALKVFYHQGVTKAALQEIAQEAGVTRGAFYWHFKNKEDLFEAIFESCYRDVFVRFNEQTLRQTHDAWQYLRDNLCDVMMFLANNPTQRQFCSIITQKCEHTQHNEKIVNLAKQYHQCLFQQIHIGLEMCVQQKTLPENLNLDLAQWYLRSNLVGMIMLWLSYDTLDLPSLIEPFINTSLEALRHSPHFLQM